MARKRSAYPIQFDVDYPKRLSRAKTFFRIVLMIPILILFYLIISSTNIIIFPVLIMILFKKKYPRWWFDWNVELLKFMNRIGTYTSLLRDEYPSTDQDQAVHLKIEYPSKSDLNRWLPLVKWILAFPHYILLIVLFIASFFAVVIAWFAILFTGKYPRSLFDFVVGVNRWFMRVYGYALILVTDKYPPFSLK